MSAASSVLSAENLVAGYKRKGAGRSEILRIPALTIRKGELIGLLGANGSGKSTLIKTLGCLQPPLDGEISMGGVPLAQLSPGALARRLSLVLTDRVSTGNLSVYEVVALGRIPYTDWLGRLTRDDEAVIGHSLEITGAGSLKSRKLGSLSDGERQKVMLARALAQRTELIILDEPTAHLDLPHRIGMMQLLRRLAREENKAVLLSSHELELTLQAADKLWLLADGGLTAGTPEDLVLNGAFRNIFRQEGVRFDRMSGSFAMDLPSPRMQIFAAGEAVALHWLGKALAREGIGLAGPAGGDFSVTAGTDAEGYFFKGSSPGGAAEFRSVEAAVAWLLRVSASPGPSAGGLGNG